MDLVNHLEGRLLFAVPKKGRLQQATLDLLAGSDIQFHRENRKDIALVKNHDIALVFLPAGDIPMFVRKGRVDLGITGGDQVAEHEAKLLLKREEMGGDGHEDGKLDVRGVEEVLELGFGKCRLQVQVPEKGKLQTPKELVGRNVVTSFVGLTEQYFARLEGQEKGMTNGDVAEPLTKRLKTQIEYAGGSVEAACALGAADGIVDLVESGETMKAAGLKAIETVFESTAVLIKSKHTSNQKLVDMIARRIRGVISAQKYVLCQYNIDRSFLEGATAITPGRRAPTITALEDPTWVAISSMVLKDSIANVMDDLTVAGATDILVLPITNSRT